jgi:hypothetical protein
MGAEQWAVYQFKVTLKGSKPPIWRRFQVASDTNLYRLHLVLQAVMGWDNSHLYQFSINGIYFGEPEPEYGAEVFSAKRKKIGEVVFQPKSKLVYEYDFGDDWRHELVLEEILPPEAGVKYPICLAGRRACPPEDCGGIWGYDELLGIIKNPRHENYREMMDWLGGEFDPEVFDLEEVDRKLAPLRKGRRKTGAVG